MNLEEQDPLRSPQDPKPQLQDPNPSWHQEVASTKAADDNQWYQEIVGNQGYYESQEAKGFTENVKYHATRIAKSAADGTAHLGSLAFRIAGALNPPMGGSMSKGWDQASEMLRMVTGTEDPGALDFLGALLGEQHKTNVYDPVSQTTKEMTLGEAGDELLNRRLGRAAIYSDVAGNVLSFATGPGALVGRTAAKAVQPLAGIVERSVSRSLAKKMAQAGGIEADAIESMVEGGRGLELLSKLPEWKQTASTFDALLAMGGRNVRDLMGMAAGNMAQSYGLMPDDRRFDAAKLAFITAPVALPLVRLGEKLASRALTAGLAPEDLKKVGEAYRRVLAGETTPMAAAKELDRAIGTARRVGSDAVAGMFEGTAFLGLDPSAIELLGKWYEGDNEAGADLMAMWMGSMAGVTAVKFGLGTDQHHMFRMVRPDLNRINTKITAEAIKEAKKQRPEMPVEDADFVQEPAPEPGITTQWDDYAGKPVSQEPDEPFSAHIARMEEGLSTRWSWADHLSLGLMRAVHQEPALNGDGSIDFTFDNDHVVNLRSENGVPLVSFDPQKILPLLKNAGRPLQDYETLAPTNAVARGEYAKRLLDDLTLLSMRQQMQGDLDFSRLGLEQVDGRPDLWQSPQGGGVYYRAQLDGTRVAKDKLGETTERADFIVADGFDQPKYPLSPAAAALVEAITYKQSITPDPVIDGIVGRAINLSMHSDSVGAEQLRQFFGQADPAQLVAMLNPTQDQILAFQLGSLAVGNNNAIHSIGEMQRMSESAMSAKSMQERTIAEDLAAAKPPMDGDDYRATLEEGDTKSDLEFKQSPEGRRVEMEQAEHTVERPLPPISDLIEPGQAYAMSGIDPRPDLIRAWKAAKRGGQHLRYFVERMPELLRGNGGDDFVDKLRMTTPRKYEMIGELQTMSRPAERAIRKTGKGFRDAIVETEGGPMPRWQAALEERSQIGEALDQRESEAVSLTRPVFERAFGMLREAGGVRRVYDPETGKSMPQPMGKPSKVRVPRLRGKEWDDVMNDEPSRMRLWSEIIDKNNLQIRDAETKEMRKMRPEEFDAEQRDNAQAATISTPGRQAAAEFRRELKWFPSVWEGKKILETDPYETIRRVTRQQAGRAASLETFGPDLEPWERKHLKEKYQVEYGPERQGLQKAVGEFVKKQPPTEAGKNTSNLARDLVTDLEGGMPERWQFSGQGGPLLRTLYGVDAPIRAGMTALSFVMDPADAAWNQAMFVGRSGKTLKMLGDLIAHPIESFQAMREAKVYAERVGTILRAEGQRDVLEASSWWQKWVDGVQWVGNMVEGFKIAYMTKWADTMLADWKAGAVTGNDRWVLADMLRFSPEQQKVLLAGEADPRLQSAFRREMVQLLTSRRTLGEGSAFSASPSWRALVRFTNWSSGNLFKVARLYQSAGKDMLAGYKEKDYGKIAAGVLRSAKATGLITASGLVSKMLAYTVAGLIREGDESGLRRWWNELAYAVSDPKMAAKYLGWTFAGQTLGGPSAMLVNALSDPTKASTWASLTTPTALAMALSKAFAAHSPTSATEITKLVGTFALEAGYVPAGSHLRNSALFSATIVGADKQTRESSRMASSWKRMEGIETPQFERTKPDEFYDALAGIRRAIADNPTDMDAALKAAAADLQAALQIGSEESLAASLRSYQIMDSVPKDKLDKFAEFMGEDRMNHAYAHDHAIREFAKTIGLMHGESATPFSKELEIAESQARLGGGQLWNGLADRVLDDAVVRLESGQDIGDEIRELAESMAVFPEQQTWLSERQLRAISRPGMTYPARARLMGNILRQRAYGRRRDRKAKVRDLKLQGVELPQVGVQ